MQNIKKEFNRITILEQKPLVSKSSDKTDEINYRLTLVNLLCRFNNHNADVRKYNRRQDKIEKYQKLRKQNNNEK
jgi:hypothetical protein